jgi:hypothetical protein
MNSSNCFQAVSSHLLKQLERKIEKERTTTNPRKNPFQPAPNTEPRPKGELPKYLSFGKMNIKLKGE